MAAKVCLLTPQEAYNYETYRVTPDCRKHRHVSQLQAEHLESDFGKDRREDGHAVGSTVRRLKKGEDGIRRSAQEYGRSWEAVTPEHHYGKGMTTMQLVTRCAAFTQSARRVQTSRTRNGEVRVVVSDGRSIEN